MMNSNFKLNLLQTIAAKKNSNKGFTLIELLVVVIIIGVLAAIALPNLLGQVAKGRQAEAKNTLGAVVRAQQAHRLEEATFGTLATGANALPVGDVTTSAKYYNFTDGTVNTTSATHYAAPKTTPNDYSNDILDYGASIGQSTAGVVATAICEANDLTIAAPATVTDADPAAACVGGSGTQID